MGADRQFNDLLMRDFAGGLNTRIDKSLIKDSEAAEIQNVDFEGAGSIQPRRGSTVFGTDNTTTSKILKTWVLRKPNALDVPMRAWSAQVEYYHSGTSDYEVLQANLSAEQKYAAASYNGSAYWGNGIDALTGWNGVYTLSNGALTGSETAVTVDSTTGFAAAGSAVINGTVFPYTGLTSTKLTGCTGLPATAPDDSPVAQAVASYAAAPKANLMAWHKFRLYAVTKGTNTLNYTVADDVPNFSGSGSGSTGFKSGGDEIKQIIPLEDFLVVFKEHSIWKFYFDSSGTVVKDLIVELPNIGCIGEYAAAQVENDIYYVAKDGNIRRIGRTANYNVGTGVRVDLSATKIQGTVNDMDSSNASMIYFDKKLYIATKETGDSFNTTVLVYDYDYEAWSLYRGWNVEDWFVHEGVLYFGGSAETNCFKALTGWKDNGGTVETKWYSKEFDFGIPNEAKKLRWIYVEGYISSATSIKAKIIYDTFGGKQTQEKTISGTGDYVDATDTISFGGTIYGDGSFARSGDDDVVLNKFRVRIQPIFQNFFTVQLAFETNGEDQVFKITKVAPYVRKETAEVVPSAQLI